MSSLNLFIYSILISCLFYTIHSYSACNEIDITFLIDASSIRQHPKVVREFINKIILDGSSEYSGFAVAVYGYNIPVMTIKLHPYKEPKFRPKPPLLITVSETQNIAQRSTVEKSINSKLQQVFKIIDNPPSTAQMKNIPLMTAFIAATKQILPTHAHANKHKHRRMMDIKTNQDKKAYFIFDYWNRVFNKKDYGSLQPPHQMPAPTQGNTNDELCQLLDYIHGTNNGIDDKNEAIYYFLGFRFHEINVKCKSKLIVPPIINSETFNHFGTHMLQNKDLMEDIFDITCPADWKFPSGGKEENKLTLGNHDQFIDDKTIKSCHFKYIDHDDDINTAPILDKKHSYLLVVDMFNDDNTFGVNQFLIADPNTFEKLKLKFGCKNSPAQFEILKIIIGEKFKQYQILKLYVDIPEPIKYIRSCKAYGNIKLARVKNINNKQNKPNEEMNNIRRRLNEWNNEINFDIMIEEEILTGILSTLKDKASNAYNFIKKTGGNIKSVSSVLGAVISPGSVSNEKNLLDIHKKQDYKWNENGELKDKKISISDNGPNLIMNGKGNIELGVGYHIDLAIDLEYKMDWDLKNGLIEIQIVIYGYFDIGAYFNAKLNGEFDIQINDLLKIAPKFTFFLGPIPITVQPYIHLKARFKALDLMINAGLDCTYKEMFVLGYRIDSKAGPNPIISLIIDKYEYIMDTIYKIKLKTLSECAKAMFKYGTGPHQQAILCKYFDYNHETRECRCKGADDDTPKLKANIATEAYVLGSECQVDKKLISIKRDGCLEIVSGLKTNINSKYICMSCQRKHIDIVEEKMENKPIMDRKEIIKECKKTLHTNGMDLSDINKCQVTTLGFDVMIRPILGIELMNLADVHLIFQMDIPLRFEIPEMRSNICPSLISNGGDVCLTQTYLKTSFSISGVLSVSLGYGLRLGPILRSLLSKFIKIGSLSQPTIKKLGEKKFEKIGCLEFKGNLIKLNKFYKKRCCDANGVKKVYRVKSHSILNEPLINEKLLNQYKNKGIFAEYPLEVKKEWGQLIKKGVESFDKKELFDMLLKSGPFHEFFKEQNENENANENKQIVVNAGRQDIYNMIDNYIYEIENNKWINKLGHNDYYKQRKNKIYKLKNKMIDRFF